MPLRFGDRVMLSSTFTANGGDGWCFGQQTQPTPGTVNTGVGNVNGATHAEGVVLFAPESPFSPAYPDQRGVLVTALNDESKIYCFRSSWLSRTAIDCSRVFELGEVPYTSYVSTYPVYTSFTHNPMNSSCYLSLGDRVQLAVELPALHAPSALAGGGGGGTASASSNTDKDIDCDLRIDGKCLGTPSQSTYGRVVGFGVIREGIQRNVEVVAVGGPRNGQVSLYPAYVLVPATRQTVITDRDLSLLHATIRHFLASHGFTIDVDQLIATFNGNVWSRVLDLATSVKGIHKDVVVGAWEAWNRERDLSWPREEPTFDAIAAVYNFSCKMSPERVLAYRLPPPLPPPMHWTCASSTCQFNLNISTKAKCALCKQKVLHYKRISY